MAVKLGKNQTLWLKYSIGIAIAYRKTVIKNLKPKNL